MELFSVAPHEEGLRLDALLARHFDTFSRTYFQHLIEEGYVLVNGQKIKKREKPSAGDEIEVCFRLTEEMSVEPEDIALSILFEDDEIIVINKPAGMVTHPAPGHPRGTFANALLFHCKNIKDVGEALRPGIVHRLDRDTSGLLVAAKTSESHRKLIEYFSEKKVQKKYLAICCGKVKEGTIDAPIGRDPIHRQQMCVSDKGRSAISHVKLLGFQGELSLAEIEIVTGRTHQIRVHMQHVKTPVLGDPVYGFPSYNQKYEVSRQLLHAYELKLPGYPLFRADLPMDIKKFTLQRSGIIF